MSVLLPRPPERSQLLSDRRSVVHAAPAVSFRGGEDHSLATITFDHDALRAPPVDLAESLHVLSLVAPSGALEYPYRLPSSFPLPGWRRNATVDTIYYMYALDVVSTLHLV